jgi:hypothetical protein
VPTFRWSAIAVVYRCSSSGRRGGMRDIVVTENMSLDGVIAPMDGWFDPGRRTATCRQLSPSTGRLRTRSSSAA